MDYQNVFKRYEIKYLLNEEQYSKIRSAMQGKTIEDKFFKSTIRNVYYDTPDYLLIRRSLEKPTYKEKLRVRSYKMANTDTKVFVELKKKYQSVVYKRRIALPCGEAESSLAKNNFPEHSQIADELNYFLKFYANIKPAVYISYEREAYKEKGDSDFRITFDRNILWRKDNLTLVSEPYGTPVLNDGKILMELKTSSSIPLWLVKVLSSEHIFKTSFSKYGSVYTQTLFKPQKIQQNIVAATSKDKFKEGELIYV